MQVLRTKEQSEHDYYDSLLVVSDSKKTVKTYKTSINHFRKFLFSKYSIENELEVFSKMKEDEEFIYQILREFVVYLKKLELRPKGIKGYLSGIKGYIRFHNIRINSDDFKQFVKIPKSMKTNEIPLDKEMILRILHNATPKLQTTILVAVSSGLRIGELVQLKLSDIDFGTYPTKITVRGSTSKTRQGRNTFLTTEASKALQDYLTRFFGWRPIGENLEINEKYIFGPTTKKGRKSKEPGFNIESAKLSLQKSLRTHVKDIPELDLTNENGYKAIHFHAFRKYFRTIVGNSCGRDYAEALMGHRFYMDTYYQLPEEKKQKMYLDAEPQLTISDYEAVEKNIETISQKYSKLEKTVRELKEYMLKNSIKVPELFSDT